MTLSIRMMGSLTVGFRRAVMKFIMTGVRLNLGHRYCGSRSRPYSGAKRWIAAAALCKRLFPHSSRALWAP